MAYLLLFSLVLLSTNAAPVPLILDTDMGGGGCMDVDDVVALCMANALADNGEADLLAVVANTNPDKVPGVISVLNHYYGRDHVPIGSFKGSGLSADSPILPYVTELVDQFPSPIKSASQVPDSVDVYRKALAAASDHSVAISSVGILTNIEALLKSGPDQHSKLSGYELVAQKVKLLAVMGGKYPGSKGKSECNLCGCAHADQSSAATAANASGYVFSHMPAEVEIIYSGFDIGINVISGAKLSSCAPASSPCRAAMINYEQTEQHGQLGRYSWDPLNTLMAVRGAAAASCSECTNCNGVNIVDGSTGNNQWRLGPASNQSYLLLSNNVTAGAAIDSLLCQTPKHIQAKSLSGVAV